ncbi:MAG: DUF4190 domain-containing protein [Deltaproteobacteria bacterium]|nr:DUF4190 domain-containing protein [Deltaproteobacteria bacterium]
MIAIIMGCLSFITCGIFLSIPGLILSYQARRMIDDEPDRFKGRDVATAGVIVNWVSVGLFIAAFVIGLILVIAIGGLAAFGEAVN